MYGSPCKTTPVADSADTARLETISNRLRTKRHRQRNRDNSKVHTQEFGSDWPAALDDILEFVILTQLSLGRGRAGVVKVSLSRERVAPDQLQPHVNRFRRSLAQKVPGMRLELGSGHHASHRVDVDYRT